MQFFLKSFVKGLFCSDLVSYFALKNLAGFLDLQIDYQKHNI
jgi:hypothetical protein